MPRSIIAGNWKMNGNKDSIHSLLEEIKLGAQELNDSVELIVFPPAIYLEQVERSLKETSIRWGAQNISAKQKGAFTGEIAAPMLNDFGCQYVLIGHSERRTLYGETNEEVAEKYQAAINAQLQPILCVGETLQERRDNKTNWIIEEQLKLVLESADQVQFKKTIIAYEPVWAIGTGLAAQPDDAQKVHAWIREIVAKFDKGIAEQLRILYGGSVKRDNARALFAMPDIDGGLIGGASLDAQEFLDIAKSCNN